MRLGFQGRYLELWCAGKCTCNYLLGVIVIILFDKLWNLLGSKGLFQQVHDPNGQHDAASHLAETIALVGHPPRALLAKPKAMSQRNWPEPVTNTLVSFATMLRNSSVILSLTQKAG